MLLLIQMKTETEVEKNVSSPSNSGEAQRKKNI